MALGAACDFNLFSILSTTPGLTLAEISKKINISYYSARVLMLCCCNTKLIYRNKSDGKYYNSSAAEKLLNSNNPDSILGYIEFNKKIQKPTLEFFTDSTKNEMPCGLQAFSGDGSTLYQKLANYPEFEKIFQNGLGSYSSWMSSKLLTVKEFENSKNILDIAGGDATLEVAICNKFSHININILELPTVCEKTNEKIKRLNLSDRIKCNPCDVFQDKFPGGFDTVFISHFVEIFSPDKVINLYKKIADYLPSSGMFILWTATADENEEGGVQAAKSSMYFLTTAGGGGFTYTFKEHEKWLKDVGLRVINTYFFNEMEHTAIVSVKN